MLAKVGKPATACREDTVEMPVTAALMILGTSWMPTAAGTPEIVGKSATGDKTVTAGRTPSIEET
jgi:hypothetical protein